MARHPAKIALVDWQRGKRYARTRLAERVAAAFSIVSAIGFALALALGGIAIMTPFLLAIPLALIMFASYAQNRGRDLFPELAGAAALALAAFSLALAGEKSAATGFALWIVLLARNIASILYVRARLRLDKARPFSPIPAIGAHAGGVIAVGTLAAYGTAPRLSLLALVILLVRAAHGLSPYRQRVRVQTIGFLEIGYGLMTVLLTALGYAQHL